MFSHFQNDVTAVKPLENTNLLPSMHLLHCFSSIYCLDWQRQALHPAAPLYKRLPLRLPILEKGFHVSGTFIDISESYIKVKHFLVDSCRMKIISPSKEHMPLSNTWSDSIYKLSFYPPLTRPECLLSTVSWHYVYFVSLMIKMFYIFSLVNDGKDFFQQIDICVY